jgi:two-component system catabolic regulation response regulator CreB
MHFNAGTVPPASLSPVLDRSRATAQATHMKPRILVVEDDEPSILDNITYSLETRASSTWVRDGRRGASLPCSTGRGRSSCSMSALPDVVGFELLSEIRRDSNVPVIFLTARASEIDRVWVRDWRRRLHGEAFSPRELARW